jgi:creatinine amidohydrolase
MGPGACPGPQADGVDSRVGLAGAGAKRPRYCRRRSDATESEGARNATRKPVMGTDAASATWPEADDARRRGQPVVLPFGALEQHGPHLPLSTDTLMATWMAEHVCDAVDGWLLPALPYGDTAASDGFAGTVSLSFDTVRAIAVDVCRSLQRAGFTSLIILNGDHGNRAPLSLAARDVAARQAWPVLVVDYPGLAEIAAEVCETPPAGPAFYHADEVETSIILALRPELVHMDRAVAGYPQMPPTLGAVPTDLAAISSSGVFGDPRRASADKGRRLLELLGEQAVALARAFLISVGQR